MNGRLPLFLAIAWSAFASGCGSTAPNQPVHVALLDIPASRTWARADGLAWVGGERLSYLLETDGPTVVRESGKETGSTVLGGRNARVVEIRRDSVAWRREAYRAGASGLVLVAIAQSGKPWITLDPPLDLVRLPATAGDSRVWTGTVGVGKQRLSARGASRIEDPVPLRLADGSQRDAWPVRTTISVEGDETGDLQMEEVRWFVPNVGIVQRARREAGRMVVYRLPGTSGVSAD